MLFWSMGIVARHQWSQRCTKTRMSEKEKRSVFLVHLATLLRPPPSTSGRRRCWRSRLTWTSHQQKILILSSAEERGVDLYMKFDQNRREKCAARNDLGGVELDVIITLQWSNNVAKKSMAYRTCEDLLTLYYIIIFSRWTSWTRTMRCTPCR